jgi:hypothetical protein
MTEEQAIRETGVAATTVLATSAICILSAGRVLQYGSNAGGWVFAWYTEHPSWTAVMLGLSLGLVLAGLLYWTLGRVQDHQIEVLVLWLVVGTVAQLLLHSLYPQSIGTITAKNANDAYIASRQHSNGEFLRLYSTLDKEAGGHVARNPPGRLVLYGWLRYFSDDPQTLGVLVLILSNLCGLALFYAVLRLYQNPATAITAFIYYLFIPARIYFAPLLNILGWAPMAVGWAILIKVLADDGDTMRWGLAFGVCIFAAFMFDLSGVLVGGLFVMTLAIYYRFTTILNLILWSLAGFVLAILLLYAFYGLNLVTMVESIILFGRKFNQEIGHRPYGIWLYGNPWEFFLGVGTPVLLLNVPVLPSVWQIFKQRRLSARALGLMVATITLLLIDFIGVNRGEVMRLWIPIMVLPCIVAADYAVECGPLVCAVSLFGLVLQTAITISMYQFIG